MLFDQKTQSYLYGNDISNGHWIEVGCQPLISRNKLLAQLSDQKDVLHIGCADHIELIEEKRNNGSYLHDIIKKASKSLDGCDVNSDALEKMRSFGISDLYTPDSIPTKDYNLVLVPDVIEHIPNVHDFLVSLKQYNAQNIVITTPNAYRLRNRSLWRKELINTDHRYWFSPYTLSKSVIEAGYKIEAIYYTDSYSRFNIVSNFNKKLFPLVRDGLAIVIY